jgi:hypothetical protein
MPKCSCVGGTTSQSVNIFIQDSSSKTGAGLTGLAYNTSGLTAYYTFTGPHCGNVDITLATLAALNSAFSSGGFKEIDSVDSPGLYRFDIPNACIAANKGNLCTIYFQGAANMAPCLLEVEITGWNNQDAVNGGMSALPAILSAVDAIPTNPLTSLGANAPTGWLVTASYGTAPAWYTAPPTAAVIAAAVLTDTTDGQVAGMWPYTVTHQLGGAFTSNSSSVFSAAALVNAPGGTGSTGPNTVPILVTDTNGNPLQNALVQVFLNNSDDQRLQTGNASPNLGKVTFSTATATYTVSIYLSGYTFTPTALAVTGNMSLQTFQMTPLSVTPSAPPYTTGYLTVLNSQHAPAVGITGSAALQSPPDSTGLVLSSLPSTLATINGEGVLAFLDLIPGASYEVRLFDSTWAVIVVNTYSVPADAGTTTVLGPTIIAPVS